LAIVKADHKNASATINSFLMSCRVIGRNVEYAFFDSIVEKLLKDGIKTMRAEYLPTAKNKQVEKFYDSLGMRMLIETELNKEYSMTLEEYKSKKIAYISVL
jgi:predicted enzyme involved in methoxymalonyl-ACP biosynthesis